MPRKINAKVGETLYSIAQTELGDSKLWREVSEYTGIDPFSYIKPNGTIELPTAEEFKAIVSAKLKEKAAAGIQTMLGSLDLSGIKGGAATDEVYRLIDWIL